jgi:hypothetical protein
MASIVSVTLLYRSYKIAVASKDRALSLALAAGLPNEMVLRSLTLKGYPLRRPERQLRFCQ